MTERTDDMEICICAAIKDTTGYIWRGHRHGDAIATAIEEGAKLPHTGEKEMAGLYYIKKQICK